MDPLTEEERQRLISPHLAIKPTLHGLINIVQLRLPKFLPTVSVNPKQKHLILQSLKQYESNLIPLIIRPIEDPGLELDFNIYEVIYGEDIYQVAQDLKLKELWAWVFDLSDEAALSLRAELQMISAAIVNDPKPVALEPDPTGIPAYLQSRLDQQQQDIAELKAAFSKLNLEAGSLAQVATTLAQIHHRLEQGIRVLDPPKPNLNSASIDDIAAAMSPGTRKYAPQIYDLIRQKGGIRSVEELKGLIKTPKGRPAASSTLEQLKGHFLCSPISAD